jgi:hypothetical protein
MILLKLLLFVLAFFIGRPQRFVLPVLLGIRLTPLVAAVLAMGINATHKKASSHGEAPLKKSGYASGPVPKQARGTKVGKTNKVGYSGPEVAQGKF